MYARVTRYKLKPDSIEDATRLLNEMKDTIMGLPGAIRMTNVINSDGSGYIISLVESLEIAEGNAEKLKEIWSSFGDFLESPPEPELFEVLVDWKA